VEKALGKSSTDELAVMWDTFKPLRLAALWRDVDQPEYAYSWNPDRVSGSTAREPAGHGQAQ
jgi:homogentisate 1,2-dioxygenase